MISARSAPMTTRSSTYNNMQIELFWPFRMNNEQSDFENKSQMLDSLVVSRTFDSTKFSMNKIQPLWPVKYSTYARLHIFRCEAYSFIPCEKRTKLVPHSCIFLNCGTDGEFGYKLWDPENWKLIWSSDVVFNEDSIFSQQNQQKTVGKKVSFKDDRTVIEGPTHRAETEIRQTVELQQADNFRTDTESATSPIAERKDTTESTRIDKGRVTEIQIRNESTTTTWETNQKPLKSQYGGGTSNKTPDPSDSTNNDRPTKLIEGSEPSISALRWSGWARRQTEFYQPGLDYVNYTNTGKPSAYEEAMAAPDADTWLQGYEVRGVFQK